MGSDEGTGKVDLPWNGVKGKRHELQINPGDGAFYGPKDGISPQGLLDRTWQCGIRGFPDAGARSHLYRRRREGTAVMIHRVITRSIERLHRHLITEHFARAYPTWLGDWCSPEVLPLPTGITIMP